MAEMTAERVAELESYGCLRLEEHLNDVVILGGSTHPELTAGICAELGYKVGSVVVGEFPDTERRVRIDEVVEGRQVFIVQTAAAHQGPSGERRASVNDAFMELLFMTDAARRGGAERIIAVTPNAFFARQDRRAGGYSEPISAAAVVQIMEFSGVRRFISCDDHSLQVEGAAMHRHIHVTAVDDLAANVQNLYGDFDPHDVMVVAPDSSGTLLAEAFVRRLGLPNSPTFIPKTRDKISGKTTHGQIPPQVAGKFIIMPDDMVDTAGTSVKAAEKVREAGAAGLTITATHGIFSGPAIERFQATNAVNGVVVTDTVPQDAAKLGIPNLTVVSVVPMLARTVDILARQGNPSRSFKHGTRYR